jgi:hypothetical protein
MERKQLDFYCNLLKTSSSGFLPISSLLFELEYQLEILKLEIINNKLSLKENGFAYLVFVETEVKKTVGHFIADEYELSAIRILKKFNVKMVDFLNSDIKNNEFDKLINFELKTRAERVGVGTYEVDYFQLYFFLVTKYANIVIGFVNDLKFNLSNKLVSNKNIKANQLTANQIVILLDKLGFFTNPKIEDVSKVKQAELVSLISGLNEKNIKTNIEKLDNKPSDVTVNYQKDIDKISKLLDDLI